MFAILEDKRSGAITVQEVPAPELRPGGILVRTAFSAISAGTERASVEISQKSLLGKALERPDQVRMVLDYARQHGVMAAYEKVMAKLETLNPLGYSCSGTVEAVGAGVTEFQPGDRVACAGAGYASHCSMNFVPKNLAVKLPANVELDAASFTTIGAIAVQGLRQAQCSFGETVAVIGAGLLGVLTVQLARAAGLRVVAIDLDAGRVAKAKEFGAHIAFPADDPGLENAVRSFSRYGVDAAIITAGTKSTAPIELAAKLCGDRGRIVIVGAVPLGLDRNAAYMKELSIVLSKSYGPGRYDPSYEEQGNDYPVGLVRWTEQRNMESFLDLLAAGALNLKPLLAHRFAVKDGAQAYENIKSGSVYTSVIEYPQAQEIAPQRASAVSQPRGAITGPVRIGCIGAGSFARSIIFPQLRRNSAVQLDAVATASGVAAASAQKNFGFARAVSTADLVADPELHAVFILTRHDSHFGYVSAALEHGQAIFVEKPLCTTRGQLDQLRASHAAQAGKGSAPSVMVGFNRRFAPLTVKLKDFFASRTEPMVIDIRVNAGALPGESWVHQDGGRIVGEGCHFVDWARAVTGSPIVRVTATALPNGARYHGDVVVAALHFADGSLATIRYLANGDRAVSKERYEVFCAGAVAMLDDFRKLELSRNGRMTSSATSQDKGHSAEIEMTIAAMRAGGPPPIAWEEILEVTGATFAIVESAALARPLALGPAGTIHSPDASDAERG